MQVKNNNFKTGAKKAAAVVSMVLVLSSILTPVAYADVKAGDILGDYEINQDRNLIKINDMTAIINLFEGIDEKGNPFVSISDVKKAVTLSDVLNSYYFDILLYTNTKPSELLSLDINRLYESYELANGNRRNLDNYCARNLVNKPAVDAFLTLGCKRVSDTLKNGVAYQLCQKLISNGERITYGPVVVLNNNDFAVFVEVNGRLRKYSLTGETCDNIKEVCLSLDKTYNLAINNIAGYSMEHDDSFMYNGVEVRTGESAWLSIPDDEKKETLKTAINLYENLSKGDYFTITTSNVGSSLLGRPDAQILESYAYPKANSKTLVSLKKVVITKVENKKLIYVQN